MASLTPESILKLLNTQRLGLFKPRATRAAITERLMAFHQDDLDLAVENKTYELRTRLSETQDKLLYRNPDEGGVEVSTIRVMLNDYLAEENGDAELFVMNLETVLSDSLDRDRDE